MSKWFWPVSIVVVVVALGAVWFGMKISVTNDLIAQQNQLQAKYDTNRTLLAAYARDIETEVGIANQGMGELDKVLRDAVAGRYQTTATTGTTAVPGQPSLFSAIKEAYPNVDMTMYNKIVDRVHDYEVKFQNEQSVLASMAAAFDTRREQFPASWFASGFPNNNLHALAVDANGHEITVHGQEALTQMENLVSSGESNGAYGTGTYDGPKIPKGN